jgi:hypothetical protein
VRLTEVHTGRITAIIEMALEGHLHSHLCVCERCDGRTESLDEDDLEGVFRVADISPRQVAQHILLSLKKLEAELIPA